MLPIIEVQSFGWGIKDPLVTGLLSPGEKSLSLERFKVIYENITKTNQKIFKKQQREV